MRIQRSSQRLRGEKQTPFFSRTCGGSPGQSHFCTGAADRTPGSAQTRTASARTTQTRTPACMAAQRKRTPGAPARIKAASCAPAPEKSPAPPPSGSHLADHRHHCRAADHRMAAVRTLPPLAAGFFMRFSCASTGQSAARVRQGWRNCRPRCGGVRLHPRRQWLRDRRQRR